MKNFIAALTFAIVFILIKLTPLNTSEYSTTNLIITISIYVIGFIIALYFSLPVLKKDWKDFKLQKWHKYIFIIISFVLLFVILKAVRFLISSILPSQSNVEEIETVKNSISIFSVMIASIPPLLAPFYEELAFRNNLFYQFKDKN